MLEKNSTFIGGEPTWANACVGENGLPGFWEYAKGFSQAAMLLIDLVLRERGIKYSVDELIYPVCFNMRHSLELRLKGAISQLAKIEKFRCRTLEFDFSGSHDIRNIWLFFSHTAVTIDKRYEVLTKKLNQKIMDIASVDATGQTFRYPLDVASQKHLVDVAIISFVVLKRSFSELEILLDELHNLSSYLVEEYSWGSYTTHLSRNDIASLALLLPHRSSWSESSFDIKKLELKKQYQIGSKELSSAIKIIESVYEFAPEIGVSVPLEGVGDIEVENFMEQWFKLNKLPSDKDPIDLGVEDWSSERMYEAIKHNSRIRKEIWENIGRDFTPEKLAGLSALFYFARDLNFSESYRGIYSDELKNAIPDFPEKNGAVSEKYFHILEKTNAVYNIMHTLYFLRKNELAEILVARYCLDEKFSWLGEARSRLLFAKASYCGYLTN